MTENVTQSAESGSGPREAFVLAGITHRLLTEVSGSAYRFVRALPEEGWVEMEAPDGQVYRITVTRPTPPGQEESS